MIHLVVALQCEARPFIHYYGMKGNSGSGPFRIYESDDMRLIVCGIGKVAAAAATAHLHSHYGCEPSCGWLNIGIAGHVDKTTGEASLAHKITDAGSGESWYPPPVLETPVLTDCLITVDRAEHDFLTPALFDMEASGFYATAGRFATAELIHCYKIVSDNRMCPSRDISGRFVEQLVGDHISNVSDIIAQLDRLSLRLQDIESFPEELDHFLASWRFSNYQKNHLCHLLRRIKTLSPHEEIWNETLDNAKDGREVLDRLQQRIDRLPVRFSQP